MSDVRVSTRRFKVGQRVSLSIAPGRYTVTRLLPPVLGVVSYRIKGDTESYERAANEGQLTPLFEA